MGSEVCSSFSYNLLLLYRSGIDAVIRGEGSEGKFCSLVIRSHSCEPGLGISSPVKRIDGTGAACFPSFRLVKHCKTLVGG